MCFNKEFTLGFTLTSLGFGTWVLSGKGIWANLEKWRRIRIASCFYYFFLMEGLQFIQYLVIDQCQNPINIFMTVLGWLHICWQPLFANIAISAVDARNLKKEREHTWRFIFRLCFVCGALMASRMILPMFLKGHTNNDYFVMCTDDIEGVCPNASEMRTCAYQGRFHVGWTFNMLKPSYPFPNVATHFINMFCVPILMGCYVQAIVLFFTGPFISMWFPARDGERSAIWCFFSIAEMTITLSTQLFVLYRSRKNERKNQ